MIKEEIRKRKAVGDMKTEGENRSSERNLKTSEQQKIERVRRKINYLEDDVKFGIIAIQDVTKARSNRGKIAE